jgi:hypothetical protein
VTEVVGRNCFRSGSTLRLTTCVDCVAEDAEHLWDGLRKAGVPEK